MRFVSLRICLSATIAAGLWCPSGSPGQSVDSAPKAEDAFAVSIRVDAARKLGAVAHGNVLLDLGLNT